MNDSPASITVSLELSTLDGIPVGPAARLSLPPNGQTAMFLDQIPAFDALKAPFQGLIRVSSPTPIAAIGFRGRYNELGDFLITTLAKKFENMLAVEEAPADISRPES